MRTLALALLLVTPALVGCLGADDEPLADGATPVAQSAEDAGAVSGPAPAAAQEAYAIDDAVTAYPVPFETSPARAPETLTFEGAFSAAACNQVGGLPLGGIVGAQNFHGFDLSDVLVVGDVFSYAIEMRYENSDASWGDIHLFYAIGGASQTWNDPTGDLRGEVVMNFTGQAYRASEEDNAIVGAACWYGAATSDIPYTITVTFTFAEGAVPAATPVLLSVPEAATKIFVRGVALDPTQGVNSHYRVFGPDDMLLCECALGSDDEVAEFELSGAGEYVILVDHTANGFVSFAMDAPSPDRLRALPTEWTQYVLASLDGGPASAAGAIELPTMPLVMNAWVVPKGGPNGQPVDAGEGRNLRVTVTNARGEVLNMQLGHFVMFHALTPVFGIYQWYPMPTPAEWGFNVDHHAYSPGEHQTMVEADGFRGDVVMFVLAYTRAS